MNITIFAVHIYIDNRSSPALSVGQLSPEKEPSILLGQLRMAVNVLTTGTCSDEGLEDATTLLLQLSRIEPLTRDCILELLLEGAQEIANILRNEIKCLLLELKEHNATQSTTKTSDQSRVNNFYTLFFVCIWVCTLVCVCILVCMFLFAFLFVSVLMCSCVYVCLCCVYFLCFCVCLCICLCIFPVFLFICLCMCFVYYCVFVHVCACVVYIACVFVHVCACFVCLCLYCVYCVCLCMCCVCCLFLCMFVCVCVSLSHHLFI